ncbi:hypothetical protein BUALT_Bualt05G0108500 [Buddleja alternifolia]|uniref:Uncharacterized protein n=1 Tax=Buddleja alternifolia TaxID=168488 RepID=A0AAV6XK85_9LAMI|nr:hypothetical protein BUALT_Bualt05G0108500 [Buddleja alternifolia]
MNKSKRFFQNFIKPFTSNSSKNEDEEDMEKIAAQEQKHFSLEALIAATKNFHPSHKLGEGGFGPVFQVHKLYKKQRSLEIVDPTLASSADPNQIAMFIHIGLLCVQSDPQLRPDMNRVVMILSRKPSNLEEPTRPGYPGSRYRRSRRANGSSSVSGTSGASSSQSLGSSSTQSATLTTSMSSFTSPRSDPKGKRPMKE